MDSLAVREADHGRITRSQNGLPALGTDHATIADLITHQHNIPARRSFDTSLILHRRSSSTSSPAQDQLVSVHEVGRRNLLGRCQDCTDVYRCILAKNYAIGILDEHLSVRSQRALDIARRAPDYTVERLGLCVRLNKLDSITLSDIERIPVDDATL
ncbi:hypothetical protein DPV79_40805 [Burkholderia reimsis]|uniref:Uncharacterized protein n=1 Tax=Burkholderia reimsis TaxID=2234132 RepID=A0A365QGI1_9BURK|nr:hypothetical protein DPV79_40805 [Burkholderia reimsis]